MYQTCMGNACMNVMLYLSQQQLVIPLFVVRMACLIYTVLAVYAMMDTLGLTVQQILMNVNQLNHLVKEGACAITPLEVLPARVQTPVRVTALLVVIVLAEREELASATIQLHLHVPVHQGLLEQLAQNLKVRLHEMII